MKRLLTMFALFSCLHVTSAKADEIAKDQVIASIAPVHSLVSMIMDGVGEPTLLLASSNTPHGFVLRPSQRHMLEHAKLVFYIDDNLEVFLSRIITQTPHVNAIALSHADGIKLLPARSLDHHHDGDEDEGESHILNAYDLHIWLSPANAKAMLTSIAQTLSETYPAYQPQFQKNLNIALARLDTLDTKLKAQLSPLHDAGFITFHDAFQYLEHDYHLEHLGSVVLSPEQMQSIAHRKELAETIKEKQIRCIFHEPQFNSRQAEQLASEYGIKSAALDPLGAGIPAGKNLYVSLMENIANHLAFCLANQ